MVKEIKIYSRVGCSPCKAVKQWLTYKNIPYTEFDIDNPEAQRQAFELTGYQIVPVTLVEKMDGSRQVITGCNIRALAACF